MVPPILVAIVVSVLLYKTYKYVFGKPENFPPGPPRLPLFGSYFFLTLTDYKHMHRATQKLAQYYKSKVLGFYYQNIPIIVVNDLKLCREVLNNADLNKRPGLPLVRLRDPNFNIYGLFFNDGETWHDQRNFSIRHLREFGFGRRLQELENHTNEDISILIDLFKNGPKYPHEYKYYKDGGFKFPNMFSLVPTNSILQVLMNERYDRENLGSILEATEFALTFQRNADTYGRIFSLYEPFKYILPNGSGYNILRKASLDFHGFAKEIVLKQYKTYDPDHERHFLDVYFKEIEAKKKDSFTLDQLYLLVVDLLLPPLSGLTNQLSFLFQRLLLNPRILAKCQAEIDRVVGRNRLPGLDDRNNLPYIEACIRECLRLDTLVVNGIPHMASCNTKVGKYDLPAGGVVFTCLQVAHEDEEYFPDPLKYKPERFLDENGALNLKVESTLVFGAGKRFCIGEMFVRNMIFLTTTAILQNFNIKLPDGHVLVDPSAEISPSGIVKISPDFWISFKER